MVTSHYETHHNMAYSCFIYIHTNSRSLLHQLWTLYFWKKNLGVFHHKHILVVFKTYHMCSTCRFSQVPNLLWKGTSTEPLLSPFCSRLLMDHTMEPSHILSMIHHKPFSFWCLSVPMLLDWHMLLPHFHMNWWWISFWFHPGLTLSLYRSRSTHHFPWFLSTGWAVHQKTHYMNHRYFRFLSPLLDYIRWLPLGSLTSPLKRSCFLESMILITFLLRWCST